MKIDKTKHYFLKMSKVNHVTFMGERLMSYTSSSDEKTWVECKIVEDRYKLSDRYKVELKALNEDYGSECFYQLDFKSLLENGFIIEKTGENQHVELVKWYEPLTHNVNLVCEAYIVVNN